MIEATNEYGIYLYTGKVDMRKGIDGLCGIIRNDLGKNPARPKSIFIFSGRNPRVKKVLVREYNRYELTVIRLDKGRFIKTDTDPQRFGGPIRWSDFKYLTEASVTYSTAIKYVD
jgi:hypothetical protein